MFANKMDEYSRGVEDATNMTISVIIPHLNQPEFLQESLTAVHSQSDHGARVEVIVVDNGSQVMPTEICDRWPGVTLLREETPGPGPARNKGIEIASGEVLAFVDADCRAHRGWLAAIERAFSDRGTDVIGGDVQVPFADPQDPTPLECYERIYAYRNQNYIRSGYSGTGNLAMRKSAFEAVGPFAGIEVAEDRDWGHRAGRAGFSISYVPEMIVYHPARQAFSEMRRKWDRHIMHDFSRVKGVGDRLRWLLRAVAVAASPLGEVWRVVTSDRLSGARQRWRAFRCLVRTRLYRSKRMISLIFGSGQHSAEGVWNRD